MDVTLAILVLVAIIYLLLIIGAVVFIVNKRKGTYKQTIDPKPQANFKNELQEK